MKIMIVHNPYRVFGGEDRVVAIHKSSLQELGHEVCAYPEKSQYIDGTLAKIKIFFKSIFPVFAVKEKKEFLTKLDSFQPDVVHLHNQFPFLLKMIDSVLSKRGISAVLTVHNYRYLCLSALLYRSSKNFQGICEKCMQKRSYFSGLIHNCRNNFLETIAYFLLLSSKPYAYFFSRPYIKEIICPSEFISKKIKEFIPEDKSVRVLSNPVRYSPLKTQLVEEKKQKTVLFVGRISEEKGVHLIPQIATELSDINFIVIGDGLEFTKLQRETSALKNIRLIGFLGRESKEYAHFWHQADIILIPSKCYESFSILAFEAKLSGKKVVTVPLGAIPEVLYNYDLVEYFEPMNAMDAAESIRKLLKKAGTEIDAKEFDNYRESAVELTKIYSNLS